MKKREEYKDIDIDLPLDLLVFAIKEGLFKVDKMTITKKGIKLIEKDLGKKTGKRR